MTIGFLYLIGYILLLGVGTFLQKMSLKDLSPYQLEFLIAIAMLIVSTGALLLSQKSISLPSKYIPVGFIVGVLFSVGSLCFTLSLTKMPVGTASVISISYIFVVVLLSSIFLKEPITVTKIIGIALTIIGVGILYYQHG